MKKTTKPQAKPTDWEAVRMLAIELGARETARRLGLKESTVLSRARRDEWNLPKRKGGATLKSADAITLQSRPGNVLLTAHKELEGRTKTGLAQATAKASEHAAKQDGATNLNCSGKLRDLASAAARIFGWDANGTSAVTLNQVVVSQEQLEQIRALRAS